MMKVVVIPASEEFEAYSTEVESVEYKFLSDKVGGMIEVVGFRDDQASMYLNEEGKILGMPRNPRATSLAKRHGAISLMDYIAGDAVVVGPVDEDGEDTGLEQEQIDVLFKEIGHK